ncbi:lytic transglycosylase domain-containing protein [Angustibacter luteus]|uniref:Lytic transglycosylase domain-containing protein n=1 Tax=Angustibacter luteus TaxID=658456 RepID=A0ABW1JAU6_9ACTN
MTPGERTPSRARWAWRAIASLACVSLTWVVSAPAQAEDAATARRHAQEAAAQVQQIQERLATAEAGYEAALSGVGDRVSDYLQADAQSADAQHSADAAADQAAASVRALYLSGGQAGLLNTVLTSSSLEDLASRMIGVDRVLSTTSASADDAQQQADRLVDVAAEKERHADAAVVTAAQLTRQADQVAALLAAAQHSLDSLSATARQLTEAEDAARALAAARRAAEAGQDDAIGAARAQLPTAEYFRLYQAAARTCSGMDWTLLAAVGQVESGHGRNAGTSSAGAQGPMQFMPGTFASYAVDGNHDGKLDVYSPADAIYTAARYLCSGGAGSPAGVSAALFRYNRAQWYVDLVLSVQAQLQATLG